MKKQLAFFLKVSGLNRISGSFSKGKAKILLYHSVVKDIKFDPAIDPADQCLTKDEFESQLVYIKKNFNIISLDDLLLAGIYKKSVSAVITFDDGFLNNFTVAYPLLKKHGLPATFFITTSFLSGEAPLSHITAKENEFFRPMHWDHVISMSKDPLVTIGSHARHHVPLTKIPEKKLYEEVLLSKRTLEEKTGKVVKYISYPRGAFNDTVRGAVERAGYKGALTTIHGFNDSRTDPFALKRNSIGNRGDLAILDCIVSGTWDLFTKRGYTRI